MKKSDLKEHNVRVREFLRKCKEDDPEQFKNVIEKYPTLSLRRWKSIRQREEPLGLLGTREDE